MGESTSVEPIIELPKYVIQDTRELPPPEAWRRAEIPGFEILTSAPDVDTQRLLKDFQSFKMAFNAVWKQADPPTAVPVTIILCGRKGSFDAFKPNTKASTDVGLASVTYSQGEQAAIVLDLQTKAINLAVEDLSQGSMTKNTDIQVDHYKQFYREYIKYIFSRNQPRPPAWVIEGIAQIAMRMKFEPTAIIFASIEDPRKTSAVATLATTASDKADIDNSDTPEAEVEDADFNIALQRRALIPWDIFFAINHDSPEALNPLGNNRWAKQAYAFVHMCIYGRGKRYQEAFLKFVDRAGKGPVSEALFKECFGMTYRKMASELKGYIDFTDYKYEKFVTKGGRFPEPAPIVFRDATDAEVGRIKGETLQLAGHADTARIAFLAPYMRGERDPNLLASFGLLERSGQRDDKARKFLEAAVTGKTTRARAYAELARMRLEEALKNPAAPDGKLSQRQAVNVLEAAFDGRSHQPAMPDTYETIAEAWAWCVVSPKPQHLAVLDEGIRLFPNNSALAYKIAELKVKRGFAAEAVPLIEHGLKITKEPALKTRFEKLQIEAKAAAEEVPAKAVPSP
jgi:hypothetical protein